MLTNIVTQSMYMYDGAFIIAIKSPKSENAVTEVWGL